MSTKTTLVSVDQRVGKWTLLWGMRTGTAIGGGQGGISATCSKTLCVYAL